MAKKLRKAKKPPLGPISHTGDIYCVRWGTPSELTAEPHKYGTHTAAKVAVQRRVETLQQFCRFHNEEGLSAIAAMLDEFNSASFVLTPRRVECTFDEHTDMRFVVEFWLERLGSKAEGR